MNITTMKELLEAGVHFGHKTSRWNPKMEKFIFMKRNEIHIIDLKQTLELINQAYSFLRELAGYNKRVLFVGTKKQAVEGTRKAAEKCDEFYVVKRWYGGLLTNMKTIRRSIKNLEEFEKLTDSGEIEKYTKLEILKMQRKYDKLLNILGGVREMRTLPDAIIVSDTNYESIAVKEAVKLDIPIIALVDTNSNPDNIDFPIPANDDAMKSVNLITDILAEAVLEGKKLSSEGADVTAPAMKTDEKTKEFTGKEDVTEEEKIPEEKEKIVEEEDVQGKEEETKKKEKTVKKTEKEKKAKKSKQETTKTKGEKSYKCNICGKEFSSSRGLKIHMGLVHQK